MNFTTGRTYRFELRKRYRTFFGPHISPAFNRVYIRRVGVVDVFKSPTASWVESFTLEQLKDFDIREVRA